MLPVVRCVLSRLPTGASDEIQNNEAQADLPAAVADRSSYRDIPLSLEACSPTYIDSWRALSYRFSILAL